MNTDLKPLAEANPVPLEDVAGWSDSAAGQRLLARVNDQLGDDVAAFTVQQPRRQWPWLVAATAAAVVVLAVAIPVLFINNTTGGDGTAAPAETIVGSWTLVRLASGGQTVNFTTGDGNSTWVTMSDSGDITGAGPCNDLSASYVVDGAVLTFSEGMVSAASCDLDMPDSGNLEDVIFSSLWGTLIELSFAGSDEMMWTFSDSGMATAMTFVRSDQSSFPTTISGSWTLHALETSGQAVVVDIPGVETPWIHLGADGTVEGSGRCNAFRSVSPVDPIGYIFNGDSVSFAGVMARAERCSDESLISGDFDEVFFALLWGGAVSVELRGSDEMIWSVDDVQVVLRRSAVDLRAGELTEEEFRQVNTWVNALGLIQVDEGVWRIRYDQMCGEGVWNTDVALRLGTEFIAYDMNAGESVRDPSAGLPLPEDAASTLWMMAVNTCRDQFPEGSIEQGPPGLE